MFFWKSLCSQARHMLTLAAIALYGNDTLSDIELVRKIQSILKSLHETGQSIPRKFVPDFSQPRLTVSRTGASLYLMLFQVGDAVPSLLRLFG